VASPVHTAFERIWQQHIILSYGGDRALVGIDRHFLQESSSEQAFDGLRARGLKVRRPGLTLGTIDHSVSTAPGRSIATWAPRQRMCEAMQRNCREFGIRLFEIGEEWHGIVHVIGPQLGFALPGSTYVCGDSHTATCGALGAWAWGIGTTQTMQVLATQALIVRRPPLLRVEFHGRMPKGVYAKDLVLALIGRFGIDAGVGHVVQYAGPVIDALPIEGRMTICNMSIEFGARAGFVAADDVVYHYLHGRPFAPSGRAWDAALAHWQDLFAPDEEPPARTLALECSTLAPQVTWGTNPGEVIGIDAMIPDPASLPSAERRLMLQRSLDYMGLAPNMPLEGVPIAVAFIGSCTNGRLADLEAAAAVLRGRKVAPGVRALVVPGAVHVKQAAEAAGLDRVFTEAGFEWREPACSMCVGGGGDILLPHQRSISSTNRNFEGRQGPSSRTHLASPAMVAAAAVTGRITDVRRLLGDP
jgi:3-isopropylmalate/(R)-2-methylmalate dehydratase large subunit